MARKLSKLERIKKTPSIEKEDYWIYAQNNYFRENPENLLIGKWLIFISELKVDKYWETIKKNTENNNLGILAKVSTAKSSPFKNNTNERVICVYNNYENSQEIFYIREKLHKLGFTWPLCYKKDISTEKGEYGCKSHLYCKK